MANKRLRQKFYKMEELLKLPIGTKLKALRYDGEEVRIMIMIAPPNNNPVIRVFKKGMRCQHTDYSPSDFETRGYKIPIPMDDDVRWKKALDSAIKRLESSSFNKPLLEDLKVLKQMGRSTALFICERFDQATSKDMADLKAYLFPFSEMYDIMDEAGHIRGLFTNKNAINLRTKTMWFGKSNAVVKQQILDAIKNGTKLEIKTEAGYDVSFSYNPELATHLASYSECFRHMENGLHCFALDENMALICLDTR